MERIRDLEHALREAKEQMIKDKRRFHYEIERIKEVNWIRGNTRLRTNIGMWLSGTPMPNFFVCFALLFFFFISSSILPG